MPIFEEKLISPLAVRFTQEHIRPVFQDGRTLESTIAAITVRPGTGDYDVILQPPFPCIEIVRWRPRDAGAKNDPNGKDWVTLDNRRLYCLQKAAAALWPRRAAVAVEVLYAATEGILRKCDSATAGRSVGIGHSPKALIGRWTWQEAVALDGPEARTALALVEADGLKRGVEDLLDAPAAPSMLDLFLQGADLSISLPVSKPAVDSGSEDSTTMPPSPRSRTSSEQWWTPAEAAAAAVALNEALVGKWKTDQGEVYEIVATGPGAWSCRRTKGGQGHSLRFPLAYDEGTDAVWWGDMNLCVDASEARNGLADSVQWYASSDNWRRRPRFLWQRSEAAAAPAAARRRARGKRAEEPAPAAEPVQEPSSIAAKRPPRARRARAEQNQ